MRIAVTGAAGFVGGAVVRALAAAGHEVLALGRQERRDGAPDLAAGVAWGAWDLADPAAVPPPALASAEAVVHAAARVAPWGRAEPFVAVNVEGTASLLDAIDPAARLIVIGSGSVHDPRRPGQGVREEDAPVAAGRYLNAYGWTKAAQERLVLARRPDAIVLRPRIVWGPGDRTLLPRLLARTRGGRLLLPDGGRAPVSMTHVDSLVAAVLAALDRRLVWGPVHVADATPVPPTRVIAAAFRAAGRPVRITPIPGALAEAGAMALELAWRITGRTSEPPVTRYAVGAFSRPLVLDLTRLHRELGIAPDVDVAAAAAVLGAELRARAVADVHDWRRDR